MRLGTHQYFIEMAKLVARRSTCARRQVGCILVDRANRVLATGYNGQYSGSVHCIDKPCPGVGLAPGTGLNLCEAIHAENNALISCRNPEDITIAYVTASPCISCVRLLLNTPCKTIVFAEDYPHPQAGIIWEKAGRTWAKVHENGVIS
jgi:dCMP deaminase